MTNTPGDGEQPQDPYAQQPYGDQPGQQQPYGQPQYDQPQYDQPQYGQPQYGQPQYGQPQQPGQPPYGQPYPPVAYAPDHPQATTSLVLGILGVVLCSIVAPFAWKMGKRTVAEIDASNGQLGGRGAAQAGYIMGIIGTILLGLAILFVIFYVVVIVAIVGGSAASSY